jgi:hypothetical protein
MSADDRFGVQDLLARYAWTIDTADVEACVANFAPDGALVMGTTHHRGHEEIRKWAHQLVSKETFAGTQHHNAQIFFVDGDGSTCHVKSYGAVLARLRDGTVQLRALGIYRDTCVKVDGTWLFEERRWEAWDADKISFFGE